MIFGITMVRDEADIIRYTLPEMAKQLDHVIVADNLSSDTTPTILRQVAAQYGNITILEDPEPAYLQSQKMTALAHAASDQGATFVVPFDADEVWHSPSGKLGHILSLGTDQVWEATLYDHVVTATDDPNIANPIHRIGYRRTDPAPLPKVAVPIRPGMVIEQGNHGVRYPGWIHHFGSDIIIHHFPYRSAVQMARKARNGAEAYAAAGDQVPQTAGQHWRDYGKFLEQGGLSSIEEIFTTWFYSPDPESDPKLVWDPCP